jgi:type II secretory pathway component HofQ
MVGRVWCLCVACVSVVVSVGSVCGVLFVVIGGVFTQETTDSENKVPFFSDLPFVGKLFRYEKAADVRKELLVFLAPRII